MKTKGWQYKMEGQFLEVVRTHFETYMHPLIQSNMYNETIHDILASRELNSGKEA